MKWCEVIGTEPYLCFNFGTGTLDEGELFKFILDIYNGSFTDYTFSSGLG